MRPGWAVVVVVVAIVNKQCSLFVNMNPYSAFRRRHPSLPK